MKDPGPETDQERVEPSFRAFCVLLHAPTVFSGVDADPVPADHEDPGDRPSGSAPSCAV